MKFVVFVVVNAVYLSEAVYKTRSLHPENQVAFKTPGRVPVGTLNVTKTKQEGSSDVQFSEPSSGQRIRLGHYDNIQHELGTGLLEVYRAGKWGIVCDDKWDLQSAHVACRELGFIHGARLALASDVWSTGNWTANSFLIDDVVCHGNESSLLECDYTTHHDCILSEAVAVVCQSNQGCVGSWVAGPAGCYLFQRQTGVMVSRAEEMCLDLGGYLVNVNSIQENDFLSNALKTKFPDIFDWIIGGEYQNGRWFWKTPKKKKEKHRKEKKKEKRKKKIRKDKREKELQRHKRDKNILQKKEMKMTLWFPGWIPGNAKQEPTSNIGNKCLALSRSFARPYGPYEEVSYYFWKSVECFNTEGLNYICEKRIDKLDGREEDCYFDAGSDYRGKVQMTADGIPCQNWTSSDTINPSQYPNQGLGEHNWCRNPDDDERPWCWTNVTTNEFGYCSIPLCPQNNQPSNRRPYVTECPHNQFYCREDPNGMCINSLFQCDGEPDCPRGEDEENCDYVLPRFVKTGNVSCSLSTKKTYGAIPLELCAKFCYREKEFQCSSFLYRKSWKYCYLTEENVQITDMETDDEYDIYQLKSA